MDELHIMMLVIIGLLILLFIYRSYESDYWDHLDSDPDLDGEHLRVIARSKTKLGPIMVNDYDYDYDYDCNKSKFIDHFEHFNDLGFEPDFAWLGQNNLLPWWNSTRSTRNSSWDLRGDVPVANQYVGPWLNSPLKPF